MLLSMSPLSVFVGRAGNIVLKKTNFFSTIIVNRKISTTKMVQIQVSVF